MSKNWISWRPSWIIGGHIGLTLRTFEPCTLCMVTTICTNFGASKTKWTIDNLFNFIFLQFFDWTNLNIKRKIKYSCTCVFVIQLLCYHNYYGFDNKYINNFNGRGNNQLYLLRLDVDFSMVPLVWAKTKKKT